MKWSFFKRFLTHVGIHIVAVMFFMGPLMAMRVSWMELLTHVHTLLQPAGHFFESPVERVVAALPREKAQ